MDHYLSNTVNSDIAYNFYAPSIANNFGIYTAVEDTKDAAIAKARNKCLNDDKENIAVTFNCG